ncbi:MAG: carbon-nitrogen hydrolase family protein [Pseudomonadota bacterium]
MNKTAPSGNTLTLLACQIEIPQTPTVAQRDIHLEKSAEAVCAEAAAVEGRVDLIVLPELSSINYSYDTFSRLSDLAEPLDGASFKTWRQVAIKTGAHVCYSFARIDESGFFISVAVVDPAGRHLGHYDKLHLAQFGASRERDHFQRGNHLFTFLVNGFRLAPIICYDIRIPELSRALVIYHGVDVILHCGAYFRDKSFYTWHHFAVTRAIENQVFLLSLNRAGSSFGQSLYCPPWQDDETTPLNFDDTKEDFREIKLDRRTLVDVRRNYSFLRDRLPNYDLSSI